MARALAQAAVAGYRVRVALVAYSCQPGAERRAQLPVQRLVEREGRAFGHVSLCACVCTTMRARERSAGRKKATNLGRVGTRAAERHVGIVVVAEGWRGKRSRGRGEAADGRCASVAFVQSHVGKGGGIGARLAARRAGGAGAQPRRVLLQCGGANAITGARCLRPRGQRRELCAVLRTPCGGVGFDLCVREGCACVCV